MFMLQDKYNFIYGFLLNYKIYKRKKVYILIELSYVSRETMIINNIIV